MSEEEREYEQITEEELIQILEDHEKWVKWEEAEPYNPQRGRTL